MDPEEDGALVPKSAGHVPIQPNFPVATWRAGGLDLRAYITATGAQWVFERVYQKLDVRQEGGKFLRRNLESLHAFLLEHGIPKGELMYKHKGHQATELEPWHDHTVSSRALLAILLFQILSKRSDTSLKTEIIGFLHRLVAELPVADGGCLSLPFEGDDEVIHVVAVTFNSQSLTADWGKLLSKSKPASDLWQGLQTQPWLNQRVVSSPHFSTLQDIIFFLCHLGVHRALGLYDTVYKLVVPELLVWLGKMMNSEASRLSSQPLQDLPLLRTRKGTLKRGADRMNSFILLDKLKKQKSLRKRIASTHDGLAAQHGNLVSREGYITVGIYQKKVFQTFAASDLPKQFAVSWDPSDYGGKNILVSTLYSPSLDCAAYMPNQQIKKLILSDLQESFIEEAKASKLGTLEGYSEVRSLSHALLKSTGCSLMDFRIPEALLARPLQDGEARVLHGGQWYIVGPGDMVRPEVPTSLDLSLLPALCSCSDQGPSNTASLNFLMFAGEGLMVQVQYDHFHRGWNDVKLSAKRSAGFPWRCMLQLVLLFNINYSPFGSGGFFYKKQSVMENFFFEQDIQRPFFPSSYSTHLQREGNQRAREPGRTRTAFQRPGAHE